MLALRFVMGILFVGLTVLGAVTAAAQDYPNKAIRLLTAETGGSSDLVARLIVQELSDFLGQQVIVENRPSAIAGQIVARATPDGYTLLIHGSSFWVGPLLQEMPYNVARDFVPISLLTTQPNVLVVLPSLPVKSVKELIALAKAKPGELNYASSGTGGSGHLAAELFKAMSGTEIVNVRYKGTGAALNDLIGGRVQLMFASAPSVAAHIKSGRLKSLAVSSAEPSALFPGLPTVAAAGLPGYVAGNASAMFAPMKTPEAILKRLNHEAKRVLDRPDVKERFFNISVEVVGSSPGQLAALIKSEVARLGKLIKDAGIKAD